MRCSGRIMQLCCLLSIWVMPFSVRAEMSVQQPLLNKVSYQMSAEKWAQTSSAKVTVSLDAALDKVGLANVNSHMLQTLQKMADKADWHITQFMRAQDKSGLETVHIEAEARVPESYLSDLRTKAKEVTKPGETYTVSDIDFSPSQAEIEKTHADARSDVYNQTKQEIDRLNQLYPDQKYFLYSINFMPAGIIMPAAMPAPMAGVAMMAQARGVEMSAPMGMAVSSKIVETAQVIVASLTKTQPMQMVVMSPETQAKSTSQPAAASAPAHE